MNSILAKKLLATFLIFFSACTLLQAKEKLEPTNAAELKAKKLKVQAATDKKFAAWKSGLSKEQQAWETVLEENLGSFYLPIYKAAKVKNRPTAWDYVKDDPKLPRILIIGDSISRGYTQAVRNKLKGKVNVHRAPENCGPTGRGLSKLDIWLGETQWDLITFNFGIHDRNTKPDLYEKNLKALLEKLKATNAKLLWIETTPIPDGTKYGPNSAIIAHNKLAQSIMKENNIPICHLYKWIEPDLAKYQNKNDVHFSNAGYSRMAEKVAASITNSLDD